MSFISGAIPRRSSERTWLIAAHEWTIILLFYIAKWSLLNQIQPKRYPKCSKTHRLTYVCITYILRRQALGSEERARTMLEDVDTNRDGQISFDEFSEMMRHFWRRWCNTFLPGFGVPLTLNRRLWVWRAGSTMVLLIFIGKVLHENDSTQSHEHQPAEGEDLKMVYLVCVW